MALLNRHLINIHGLVVPGKVIDKRTRWVRGGTSYQNKKIVYDIVSFQPRGSAEPMTFESNSPFVSYSVGCQVKVMYLPGNVKSARIQGPRRWLIPGAWTGFWLVLAALVLAHTLGILH